MVQSGRANILACTSLRLKYLRLWAYQTVISYIHLASSANLRSLGAPLCMYVCMRIWYLTCRRWNSVSAWHHHDARITVSCPRQLSNIDIRTLDKTWTTSWAHYGSTTLTVCTYAEYHVHTYNILCLQWDSRKRHILFYCIFCKVSS